MILHYWNIEYYEKFVLRKMCTGVPIKEIACRP